MVAGEGHDEGRGMDMLFVVGTMVYVESSWYDPFIPVNNHTEQGFAGIQVARAWGMGYVVGRELGLMRGTGALPGPGLGLGLGLGLVLSLGLGVGLSLGL